MSLRWFFFFFFFLSITELSKLLVVSSGNAYLISCLVVNEPIILVRFINEPSMSRCSLGLGWLVNTLSEMRIIDSVGASM
ncbi:hypothetical protein Hanom_Chr16g01510511 [Helianthus anomalus]